MSGRQFRQRGFTLVELIMVIVIAGVLAVGVTSFITHSVGGYVDTARRQMLGGAGMVATEKLARMARGALPNSIRIVDGCLEFIPIKAGSTYITLPLTSADTMFTAVAYSDTQSVEGYVAVYPIHTGALYAPSAVSPISSSRATLPAGNGQVEVQFAGATTHRFPTESPSRRFYVVDTPVAFCQEGRGIFQYGGYGFVVSPSALKNSLPTSGSGRQLLIDQVVPDSLHWDYTPATLQRNAVVRVSFKLQDVTEPTEVVDNEQEIQIRNVP